MRSTGVAALVAAAAGLALFAVTAVHAGLTKYYSIDEFMHAHASWLVGRGRVPFRDFCDFHFPLLYQALGLVWAALPDDPENIRVLRGAMLVAVALLLGAAAVLNRREGRLAALLAPALALSIPPFVARATEIRHDTLAFALYLAALAVLTVGRPGPRARGALSGLLLVLAVWASQKVLMYGAPFGLLLAVEVLRGTRRRGPSPLGSRKAFAAGAGGALAVLAGYLAFTRSGPAFFEYAIWWALRWQADYPPFPWTRDLAPVADRWAWLLVLGAVGVAFSAAALARGRTTAPAGVEAVLLGSLATSFLFFWSLSAPYEYNLVPFFGLLAVFAARGLSGAVRRLSTAGAVALGVAVLCFLVPAWLGVRERTADSNAAQHDVLAEIGALTSPDDVAYDNSGSYVARPSASFYFYTDAPMRARLGPLLEREIPKAILDRGAVLAVRDARFDVLSATLQQFLRTHFQPLSGDLWLWGQRFRAEAEGRAAGSFTAVVDGRYFVSPPDTLSKGTLRIDGVPVTAPAFDLRKGERRLEWDGAPGADFFILWLPRNGRIWTPRPDEPRRLSRIL